MGFTAVDGVAKLATEAVLICFSAEAANKNTPQLAHSAQTADREVVGRVDSTLKPSMAE